MTTRLRSAGSLVPFSSDHEYLDCEMAWLRSRVSRIVAEHRLADARAEESDGDPAYSLRPGRDGSRELRCRVVELREREQHLRQEIDARLVTNREQRGAVALGLDALCREHGLADEERQILLTALPYGISQSVAESTLKDLVHHWGSISVADCITVLDPPSIGAVIEARRYFRPANGSLLRHGLITVSRPGGDVDPSTLMCSDVSLTLDAFARITGDREAVTEAD